MRKKAEISLVLVALFLAQIACNAPTTTMSNNTTQLPPQSRTLTALAQSLNPGTGMPNSPVVFTATPGADGAAATATTAPGGATATNTPVGQPTVPNIRPRSPVVAQYLENPPTIDGDWSEWKDITQEYPANSVVFGPENRTGDEDLAGSFHVGWDEDYLYLAVKVRDDRYVQNATGQDLFKGDSIEILLDTKLQEDFYYNSVSPDDFQLGISPGRPDPNGAKEAYLWMPENVAGARSGLQIASRQENGQYRVEAAIPWHVFETTPTAGTHMGFAISISDNDNPSSSAQQSMVSNTGDRRLTDPTTWGDILFKR